MHCWLLFVIFIILDLRNNVSCLLVTDINVPDIVDFRDNVTISCSYDMRGHTLNSVKWYKDNSEFFRYSPMMHPLYMKFPVNGVHVQDGKYFCNESTCRVDLHLLGAKSTGVYRCEVSGDAPLFKLASEQANMTVAALPQYAPLIEDFSPIYRFDEPITATCTSDYSSLPTKLTWFINGEPATLNELQLSDPESSIAAHDYILRRQKLQLILYLSSPRFDYRRSKDLELKCVAEIENFPELRHEKVLTADLLNDDNLNNQMLIHSGAGAERVAQTISALFVMLFVTLRLARLL